MKINSPIFSLVWILTISLPPSPPGVKCHRRPPRNSDSGSHSHAKANYTVTDQPTNSTKSHKSFVKAQKQQGRNFIKLQSPTHDNENTIKILTEQNLSTPAAWRAEHLLWHNLLRRRHNVSDLELDIKLCHEAEEWAEYLGKRSDVAGYPMLTHEFHPEIFPKNATFIGENLGGVDGIRSVNENIRGGYPVRVWYSEITKYNWKASGSKTKEIQKETGHFTQVVWKATKRLGVGRVISPLNGIFIVVTRYSPNGNVNSDGEIENNVLPPVYGDKNRVNFDEIRNRSTDADFKSFELK